MSIIRCANCHAPQPQASPGSVIKCAYCGVQNRVPIPTMWKLFRQPVKPPPLPTPDAPADELQVFVPPPVDMRRALVGLVFVVVAFGVAIAIGFAESAKRDSATREDCASECQKKGLLEDIGNSGSGCSCRPVAARSLPKPTGPPLSQIFFPAGTSDAAAGICGAYVRRAIGCLIASDPNLSSDELPSQMSSRVATCLAWVPRGTEVVDEALTGCEGVCPGFDPCMERRMQATAEVEAAPPPPGEIVPARPAAPATAATYIQAYLGPELGSDVAVSPEDACMVYVAAALDCAQSTRGGSAGLFWEDSERLKTQYERNCRGWIERAPDSASAALYECRNETPADFDACMAREAQKRVDEAPTRRPPSAPEPSSGSTTRPRPASQSSTGSLDASCSIPCTIYVDGRRAGPSPVHVGDLRIGRHEVSAVNQDQGMRESRSIVIRAGETATVRIQP
jgi:hypothetical protein